MLEIIIEHKEMGTRKVSWSAAEQETTQHSAKNINQQELS